MLYSTDRNSSVNFGMEKSHCYYYYYYYYGTKTKTLSNLLLYNLI